jgi:hypothetical protein
MKRMTGKHIMMFIYLILFLTRSVSAQEVLIRGVVTDEVTSEYVENVHITIDGVAYTTTDKDGAFNVPVKRLPIPLTFTHIGYYDTTLLLVSSDPPVAVSLKKRNSTLPTHTVVASPVELMKDKPYYIIDFEIKEQQIYMLAYPEKQVKNPHLFLLDFKGNVIADLPLITSGELFLDIYNNIWLIYDKTTYTVEHTPSSLILTNATEKKTFSETIQDILTSNGSNYYLKRYAYDNQVMLLFSYNNETERVTLFREIVNETGIRLRETRHIFETNEFERRFSEMVFFSPLFVPIFTIDSSLLIYNFIKGEIEEYDQKNKLISKASVTLHTMKGFTEEIIIDPVSEKVYVLFQYNGISTLCRINPKSGKIIEKITIPSFPFIENIRIYNGYLFFLYKKRSHFEYKKIWRLKI